MVVDGAGPEEET